MLQIMIQGRGGQGAQTAGNLLAMAFFAAGRQVQSFSSYGGARRGTPVNSYIRIDDRPIRLRCDIEKADAILCFDASLLEGKLLATARSDTLIVVNSAQTPEHFAQILPGYRVIPVDGLSIARRNGLGRIVNSALLGAIARAIEAPPLDALSRTLTEEAPKLHDENIAACEEGYRCVDEQLGAHGAPHLGALPVIGEREEACPPAVTVESRRFAPSPASAGEGRGEGELNLAQRSAA
ncbi:MAG TPA: 2-oxoacid:acceptor oxidoreductase family protein [Burkholderiaceae bacterium]|nr:2-oxoacid:acceptor oxidoreductase family protein [Burkholderiaceae bacterium]